MKNEKCILADNDSGGLLFIDSQHYMVYQDAQSQILK